MTNKTLDLTTTDQDNHPIDWPLYTEKLATALASLEEDEFLILVLKGTNRFVQFSAQGDNGMRAETTSNAYLSGSQRLDDSQIAALLALGWYSPTGSPDEAATPDLDPCGSPNYFGHIVAPVPFKEVAEWAVKTLTEVLGAQDPGCLEYEHFSSPAPEVIDFRRDQ